MIYKLVPECHKKMVLNLKKQHERTKRKRAIRDALANPDDDEDEAAALVPSKPKPETIEEILQESESESDDEGEKVKDQKGGAKAKRPIAKRGKAWLKEGGDTAEPLDFLDPSISKRVLATKPEGASGQSDGSKGHVKHSFKTMPDGRLFISEPGADDEQQPAKRGGAKRKRGGGGGEEMDELEMMMDEELAQYKKGGQKRNMEDVSISDDEEDQSAMKYQAGGSGIHRPTAVAKKPSKPEKAPGAEYKSKKARGDMKKKGKPDPYSYIPLNRQQLNKRKAKKPAGQWQNLITAAKKGAVKGHKGNKKHKKKR